MLAHAQQQAALLASLEREMARSKEYLSKVRTVFVIVAVPSDGTWPVSFIIPLVVGRRCIQILIRHA